MTSVLRELWAGGVLPIETGLYLGTGEAVGATLGPGNDAGFRFTGPLDLARLMRADPQNVTEVDVTAEEPLEDGGRLVCGDGAWGSEGFFGRLGADEEPRWIMYFEFSNPFAEVLRAGSRATFVSTSAVTITVDIHDPRSTPGTEPELP